MTASSGTAGGAGTTVDPGTVRQRPVAGRDQGLVVDGISVQFSGIMALNNVSFQVTPGEIHALIGPNGAGKSTTFNVICGVYKPTEGEVLFDGQHLLGLAPHQVADRGVARAFQNIALFPAVSVEDNLMLGRHRLTRAGFVSAGLGLPSARREDRRHRTRVREIADFLRIGHLLSMPAGGLSYGNQKRVEIARALCAEPRVLLLDEPVAGMNADESSAVAQTILDVRDGLDVPVLLVEHDMGLVMTIADHITVLDFGEVIADGTPDEVRNDPNVITAYLGTSELAHEMAEDMDVDLDGADLAPHSTKENR